MAGKWVVETDSLATVGELIEAFIKVARFSSLCSPLCLTKKASVSLKVCPDLKYKSVASLAPAPGPAMPSCIGGDSRLHPFSKSEIYSKPRPSRFPSLPGTISISIPIASNSAPPPSLDPVDAIGSSSPVHEEEIALPFLNKTLVMMTGDVPNCKFECENLNTTLKNAGLCDGAVLAFTRSGFVTD